MSLEKHPGPRLLMNKNKKQVDILILIYSDFTLIFFFSLFSNRREDEFKAGSKEEGWEGQTAPLPFAPITWSQFHFLSLSLALPVLLKCWKMVDFSHWSTAGFLLQSLDLIKSEKAEQDRKGMISETLWNIVTQSM